MKRILLLFIPALALASPENPTRQELLQTVAHIEKLAEETQAELEQEKLAHKGTQDALTFANSALSDTRAELKTYQNAVETITTKANQAIADRDHLLAKLHLAKWIMCALAVAAIAFVAMKIPPPIGLYIGGAAAVAAVGFIWFWL